MLPASRSRLEWSRRAGLPGAQDRTGGEIPGRPWGELAAAHGDFRWPPTGRISWPRTAAAPGSRRWELELCAPPAIPSALLRGQGGAGQRRRSPARARGRKCRGGARRAAAPHGRRAGALRSPLAFARPSQSSRRSLRGRSPAGTRAPPGGGLAASAFPAVARPGDIDSVAIAPTGVGIVIETKTRTYDRRHLARLHEQAAWLSRRRRRWCCRGALGVLCLVRARGVQRCEQDVLVVSIDRLTPILRSAAGTVPPVVQSSR